MKTISIYLASFVLFLTPCSVIGKKKSIAVEPKSSEHTDFRGSTLYIDLKLDPKRCFEGKHTENPFRVCGNKTCNECYKSRSLEYTNLFEEYIKHITRSLAEGKLLESLIVALLEKHKKGQIGSSIYRIKMGNLNYKNKKYCEERNAFQKVYDDLRQKIEGELIKIGTQIAKSLGASALIRIGAGRQVYINPEYDITQQAFDQLNREYLAGV